MGIKKILSTSNQKFQTVCFISHEILFFHPKAEQNNHRIKSLPVVSP